MEGQQRRTRNRTRQPETTPKWWVMAPARRWRQPGGRVGTCVRKWVVPVQNQRRNKPWTVVCTDRVGGFLASIDFAPVDVYGSAAEGSLATLLYTRRRLRPAPGRLASRRSGSVQVSPSSALDGRRQLVAPKVIPNDIKLLRRGCETIHGR